MCIKINYDACAYYTMGVVGRGVPELAACVRARRVGSRGRASAISQLDYNVDLQAGYLSSCIPVNKSYS